MMGTSLSGAPDPECGGATPAAARGFFIAVEGGEGAGKGSVIERLSSALRHAGKLPLVTREPGGTEAGRAVRALVVERGYDWDPMAELLLIMADRAQHVARVIRPALATGQVVLCDRFVGSTIAYQGAGRGIAPATIAALQDIACGGLAPDMTLLLDVDPEAWHAACDGWKRSNRAKAASRRWIWRFTSACGTLSATRRGPGTGW
jgi:dTMP kinase